MEKQWLALPILIALSLNSAEPSEYIWLEAEHLQGIRGYCWPMGDDKRKMRETNGHWGISGPGWAAEWNQGGESGFLSIATGAADDKAEASKVVEIPEEGEYSVWVRYGDWREKPEPFEISIQHGNAPVWTGKYGASPVIDEDNVMKLYWGWAFVWAKQTANLQKGAATLKLISSKKAPEPRQVDVIVLTTDKDYRPFIKEHPNNEAWKILDSYRPGIPDLKPLAKKRPDFSLPSGWKIRSFKDRGFLYLWNVGWPKPEDSWLGDDPAIKIPYRIGDAEALKEFEEKYRARESEIPIFSDKRITPLFHGVGPIIFGTDPETGEVNDGGKRFARWLDEHPERQWGGMMNYAGPKPIGPKGQELFKKYRDRYVGSIAGESLGYFYPKAKQMQELTALAETRRQLVRAFTPYTLQLNREKYEKVFGRSLDANPYEDVISCLSVGNITFAPLLNDWGCRTLGYESFAACSSVLGMRWAFMRGIGRQGRKMTATYRSCNFGDSATMFTVVSSYTQPKNILDNYYSVYSGAGMTWYKFDIWYQYMAGSSMFYHEQGFDKFWKPGGTSAAGKRGVQLSPKGKLVDRFLRVTGSDFDRGAPYTPIAFLVDYAHGWEPAGYWPNAFKNWHQHQNKWLFGLHEKMLEQYFWTAYHPIGPESQKPVTGTNEVYLAGVYGDIFDVICAYPDPSKWATIDTYPEVIANGEIELTHAEGQRLRQYMEQGGTLLVADAHLAGPGLAILGLPKTGAASEAGSYSWMGGEKKQSSALFRLRSIKGGEPLAKTADGQTFCAMFDVGKGRLIYLSVPYGLTIGRQIHPVVPQLIAHLSRGLMPIEVKGDVNWLVNRNRRGWMVTLLNPAGQSKPQQGITPTDFRQNRQVQIVCNVPVKSAVDRLLPDDRLELKGGTIECEVVAGGLKIVELWPDEVASTR